MLIRGKLLLCLFVLLFIAVTTQAYEVILKNGKVVKGTLVSDDDSMIVIRDADGLRINVKKTNVDAEKTKAANPVVEHAPPVEPAKPATVTPPAKPQPETRKPAKKVTEEDLEKLREKYDLGEGTFKEGEGEFEPTEIDSESDNDDFSLKSEGDWQAQSENHRERVKAAEERYTQLAQQCQELKQITVQTHTLVDEQGNELQMSETSQQVCEMADSAKSQLEEERARMEEFLNSAREKAIPPGWLRDNEGKDPN